MLCLHWGKRGSPEYKWHVCILTSGYLEVKAVKRLLQLVDIDEDDFAVEANLVKNNILTPTNPLLKE